MGFEPQRVTQQRAAARLIDLRQRLAPIWPAHYRLRIRCGHCVPRRLLDELVVTREEPRGTYSISTYLPTSIRRSSALGEHPTARRGITRPSVTRMQGAFGRPDNVAQGHDVWLYECHRRCGATYSFNEMRMLEVFLDAFAKGKTEVVAGIDL
jgi:hypothetical protein